MNRKRPHTPVESVDLARLESLTQRELAARCQRALFASARGAWTGSRAELRRAIRRTLRPHRRDRSYLFSVLRAAAASSASALLILGVDAEPASAATPSFVEHVARPPFDGVDIGDEAYPALADLDGDGDLDAVVGYNPPPLSNGPLRYFENTGTFAPVFIERTGTQNPFDVLLASSTHAHSAVADLDGDGDLDLIAGRNAGTFSYLENTGSTSVPAFVERTGTDNPMDGEDVGARSTPALVDLDDDGDLDLLSGAGFADLFYFENTGTAMAPAFSARTGTDNPFHAIISGVYFATPALADLDDDGDHDLVVAGGPPEILRYWENTGGASAPAFVERFLSDNPLDGLAPQGLLGVGLADLDDDGDNDLLTGLQDGTFEYLRNTGSASTPAFAVATGFLQEFFNDISFPVTLPVTGSFADLDGDGDLDFAAGSSYVTDPALEPLRYFENTGSRVAPAFTQRSGTASPFDVLAFTGYGNPQPDFGDLDADGDLDLVVGLADGNFSYFENTGSLNAAAFVLVTGGGDPLSGVDVGTGARPVLVDLDRDGDLDIASGRYGYPTINPAYIENTGTATAPAFVERTGTANPLGASTYSFANPAFADFDADGDLDLAFSNMSGLAEIEVHELQYFENTGSGTSPDFAERTGTANPFGTLTPAPAPLTADVDGDGDLDVFSPLELASAGSLLHFENTTAPESRVGELAPGPGPVRSPSPGDLDADGDLDLIDGRADGTFVFHENTGDAEGPVFVIRTGTSNPLDGFDVGTYAAPALGDLDGDGDLDVVSGTYLGHFDYFENTGDAVAPTFVQRVGTANPLDGEQFVSDSSPALADLDGDGDLDLVAGRSLGGFALFENTGDATTPAFAKAAATSSPFLGLDVGDFSTPALADLDGDGDLDLTSGELYGTFAFFENTGTPLAPVFAERTGTDNPLAAYDVGFDSAPALADLDADGDLELIAGRWPAFVEQTGSTNPLDGLGAGTVSSPTLADLDGDGDADLLAGNFAGTFTYHENTGSSTSPAYVDRTGTDNPLNGVDLPVYSYPVFVDLDDDGDFDLVAGSYLPVFAYFENTGSAASPAFVERTGTANPLTGLLPYGIARPAFADLDGDGDLDLSMGLGSSLIAAENTGSASSPAFSLGLAAAPSGDPFAAIGPISGATPVHFDFDGDGDLDAVVGDTAGEFHYLENTGSSMSPDYVERTGLANPLAGHDVVSSSTPTLVDLDGDGRLDLVSGSGNGDFSSFLGQLTPSAPPPPPAVPAMSWAGRALLALGMLGGAWRRKAGELLRRGDP